MAKATTPLPPRRALGNASLPIECLTVDEAAALLALINGSPRAPPIEDIRAIVAQVKGREQRAEAAGSPAKFAT